MKRRLVTAMALSVGLVGVVGTSAGAGVAVTVAARASVTGSMSASMPLVRLAFATPLPASKLPPLVVHPSLATSWQQIGPREVQAVATGAIAPLHYVIDVPTALSCATRCRVLRVSAHDAASSVDLTWEDQLLATLHYLPVTFTPLLGASDAAQKVPGTYTWAYPQLPAALASQWRVGSDNVILTGALMSFQNDHHLATTGVTDAATWNALVDAVRAGEAAPHPYNYVAVSMASPERLTLYVAGHARFRTLVNTGISVAPTATGTYPVYLRYTSQTMSGTNPDGTHYSDPGIPWVSYFNGGDALHGFIRATYGWPQSLGCVEMPFAAAKTVWPSTPIGTLVTVS
ncbi:MAG TPA: L,D-transpeptidase [Acidimicrobiales bacterium]|nr:L,D-transpeptidase [Acidimicrobiales bacterium]